MPKMTANTKTGLGQCDRFIVGQHFIGERSPVYSRCCNSIRKIAQRQSPVTEVLPGPAGQTDVRPPSATIAASGTTSTIITNRPAGGFETPKNAANTAAIFRVHIPSAMALRCGCSRPKPIV